MHPSDCGGPTVLGFELKLGTGRMTPEQRQLIDAFVGLRAHFVVCRSVEEVEEAYSFAASRSAPA